jgi:hypothetical protein
MTKKVQAKSATKDKANKKDNSAITELVNAYVEKHNQGVAAGKFDEFISLFAQDAEMTFAGSDFGPFKSQDEIAQAFAKKPPSQNLQILCMDASGNIAEVTYSFQGGDGSIAGIFRLEESAGKIVKVIVRQVRR